MSLNVTGALDSVIGMVGFAGDAVATIGGPYGAAIGLGLRLVATAARRARAIAANPDLTDEQLTALENEVLEAEARADAEHAKRWPKPDEA